ncbi:hypothetical protein BHE74_00010883 [Ensete ventricosum]|nr:hypothetical protein BHE74_00010883 [Ensete ventricosum]RZS01572.1 hypothetical protein BHM03_00031453 [Ensete ventricosum]
MPVLAGGGLVPGVDGIDLGPVGEDPVGDFHVPPLQEKASPLRPPHVLDLLGQQMGLGDLDLLLGLERSRSELGLWSVRKDGEWREEGDPKKGEPLGSGGFHLLKPLLKGGRDRHYRRPPASERRRENSKYSTVSPRTEALSVLQRGSNRELTFFNPGTTADSERYESLAEPLWSLPLGHDVFLVLSGGFSPHFITGFLVLIPPYFSSTLASAAAFSHCRPLAVVPLLFNDDAPKRSTVLTMAASKGTVESFRRRRSATFGDVD